MVRIQILTPSRRRLIPSALVEHLLTIMVHANVSILPYICILCDFIVIVRDFDRTGSMCHW